MSRHFSSVMMQISLIICSFTGKILLADDFNQSSIFKKIMEQSYCVSAFDNQEWPDEDFYEYLMRCMQYQSQLNEQKKRSIIFKMLDNSSFKQELEANNICNDTTTWQDLNLFYGQENLAICVGNLIDRTYTSFGKVFLHSMLINPTISDKEIERRQRVIRYLLENPEVLQSLEKALDNIQQSESIFISFWCEDPIRQEIKKERYLQWPIDSINNYVNKSEFWLSVINSWGHLERFLYLRDYILGSLFVTARNGLALANIKSSEYVNNMSLWLQHERGITAGPILTECLPGLENRIGNNFLGLLAGLYAFMNIYDWGCWTRDQLYLDSCVHMKMMHVAQCVNSMQCMHRVMSSNDTIAQNISSFGCFEYLFGSTCINNSDMKQLLDLLSNHSFKEKPSFSTHKGRSLLCFKLMNEHKEYFEDICVAIGEIDMYVSLVKLFKEQLFHKAPYCFVQFVAADKPLIEVTDFWNIFVDKQKAVLNSVTLGGDTAPGNMIITGPNSGGKSTILKAIALNVLLAQSFGIACARTMRLTPFHKIMTYMNIKGDSLFKIQVLRAQKLLETVQSLGNNKCLIIIDEDFNGTSPRVAQASSYSFAKNLGKHAHAVSLIATHFPLLTCLEKDSQTFSNYRVDLDKTADGKIMCPFTLKKGIFHQYGALDILRSQGLYGSIISDADAIVSNTGRIS